MIEEIDASAYVRCKMPQDLLGVPIVPGNAQVADSSGGAGQHIRERGLSGVERPRLFGYSCCRGGLLIANGFQKRWRSP
jgi:hypothetical protein